MLPAHRKPEPTELPPDQAEGAAAPPVQRGEEITKVRPTSLSLLRALMDAVEESSGSASANEVTAPPVPPESGIRVLESTVGEARIAADSTRPPAPSEVRELLPTDETVDRWFDTLCARPPEEPEAPTIEVRRQALARAWRTRAKVALVFAATLVVTAAMSASVLWALFRK